ncbi:MAG: alpha/beta hydrolase [Deltaproteobacteria bacterium]|nr:alpha/beta hydrolase [Deltaproteobacteria bacterium]
MSKLLNLLDKKEKSMYIFVMKLLILIAIFILCCQTREETSNKEFNHNNEITFYDISDYDISEIQDTEPVTDTGFKEKYECKMFNLNLSENNDNTDIYLPITQNEQFYLILLLQGSDLSKKNYSLISERICNYGFAVAVFDHYKESFSGKHLYSEQNATNEIFYKIIDQSEKKDSFLFGKIKKDKFILFGHSYGAGCGLFMIGNECKWPFCSDKYERPDELSGGIFYGISLKSPYGETYYKINNENIPVLLIGGDNDGAIKYEYAEKTFESIENPPKIFVRLKGANHYAVNDTNPPPGADADKNIQSLNQNTGLEIISSLSAAFISEYILKDESCIGYFKRAADAFSEYIEVKTE